MKTLHISIEDGVYPTFVITKDKIAGVEIKATTDQLKSWKAANAAYVTSQKEIEALVNHYEPAAVAGAIALRAQMIERNNRLQKNKPGPGENYPPYPEN